MEGQLSEHPLAELISEILEKKFSGALRVVRERVQVVVYFESGDLIYATSNLSNFRLIEYLKKRGLDSKATGQRISASDFATAKALIAKGVLTQSVLDEILIEQVADVVRVALLWTSGRWSFDNRARLTETIQRRIQIQQLLIDAARRMDLQLASSRFPSSGELLAPGSDSADHLNLSPIEGFVLSRVEAPIAIDEVVAVSGLRELDARRTIYGLVLARVLKRELWPYAFITAETATTLNAERKAAPKPSSFESAASNVESQPARDAQLELKEFLDGLALAKNHYEVLNVPATADAAEVKRAYYSLARRFHPDRFHELARTSLHTQLESAFARITQAHEMLSNPDLRSSYDAKLAALKKVSNSSTTISDGSMKSANGQESTNGSNDLQLAANRFREGAAALQSGQTSLAISCLSAAAQLAPKQASYRAYYGRALAAHQQTQRMAEAELQAAVRLDPENASYRVLLAGLYRSLGFSRRAIAELERALSIDSNNAEARQMLQALEAKIR